MLKAFVDQHEHVAIVRDTTGICQGLVTLEDVVEELVGELEDEFDRLPRHVHAIGNGVILVGGGCSMRDVGNAVQRSLPISATTVAAWMEGELHRTPRVGDVVRYPDVEFGVRRMRRGRVFEATVSLAFEQ